MRMGVRLHQFDSRMAAGDQVVFSSCFSSENPICMDQSEWHLSSTWNTNSACSMHFSQVAKAYTT